MLVLSSCLLCLASAFSGVPPMSSGKSHCIFDLSFAIKLETVLFPQRLFLLRRFEKPFYKKSAWDAVLKIVQSELGTVKTKAIKNNPKKENGINSHDKRSSVNVNLLS